MCGTLTLAAQVDILQTGAVRAEAVIPKGTKGKLAADLMETHTSMLAPDTFHAEFRLKFANSTRKQPVFFQFHVSVNLRTPTGAQQFDLSSTLTRPTISVTNEVCGGGVIVDVAVRLWDYVSRTH